MEKTTPVSVHLKDLELKHLDTLTLETGRSRAGVIRRLIAVAEYPEVKRALGIVEATENTQMSE